MTIQRPAVTRGDAFSGSQNKGVTRGDAFSDSLDGSSNQGISYTQSSENASRNASQRRVTRQSSLDHGRDGCVTRDASVDPCVTCRDAFSGFDASRAYAKQDQFKCVTYPILLFQGVTRDAFLYLSLLRAHIRGNRSPRHAPMIKTGVLCTGGDAQ